MVFAVQCPNKTCRKFMLVEDHELNKIVQCLLCKTAIKIGSPPSPASPPPVRGKHPPPKK